MNSDLVHSAGEGSAHNNAGAVAVVQPLELCPALLAVRADLANANFIAHNLNWLSAFGNAPKIRNWKLVRKICVSLNRNDYFIDLTEIF